MEDMGIALLGCLLAIVMVVAKLAVGVLLVNGVMAVMGGYEPTLWEKVLWLAGLLVFLPGPGGSSDSKK